jgi:uncharacterized membrane protein YgdD (TMEM256/DUF423 family)
MRAWLICGAINAFISVAAGAFAAHGLKSTLSPYSLDVFHKGAQYQMYHALALLVVAWLARDSASPWVDGAGYAFTVGIVLFSGSLYVLALTGVTALGAITPFGGVGFLAGWVMLAIAGWKAG